MSGWWRGPDFLHSDESNWPKNAKFQVDNLVDQSTEFGEVQSVFATLIQVEKSKIGELIDCENYSDYDKLVRMTWYVVHFAKKSTEKERTPSIILGTSRKRNTLLRSFVAKGCSEKPNFKQRERSLRLFHDYEGIFRSQGSLDCSQLPY